MPLLCNLVQALPNLVSTYHAKLHCHDGKPASTSIEPLQAKAQEVGLLAPRSASASSAGRHLARYASALGMRVIATTSRSTRMELEHLLQEADVVSIHCPLTDKTWGLLGRAELELMRSGALLINYSRGEVLNEQVR